MDLIQEVCAENLFQTLIPESSDGFTLSGWVAVSTWLAVSTWVEQFCVGHDWNAENAEIFSLQTDQKSCYTQDILHTSNQHVWDVMAAYCHISFFSGFDKVCNIQKTNYELNIKQVRGNIEFEPPKASKLIYISADLELLILIRYVKCCIFLWHKLFHFASRNKM